MTDEEIMKLAISAYNEAADAPHDDTGKPYDIIAAAIRYGAAQAEPVAIKPLEWEKNFRSEFLSYADTILGRYRVWSHHDANGDWYCVGPDEQPTTHPSEQCAKAAVQADYEARIRSALTTSAPQLVDVDTGKPGLREILAKAYAYKSVGDPHALDIKGEPRWKWFLDEADKFLSLFGYLVQSPAATSQPVDVDAIIERCAELIEQFIIRDTSQGKELAPRQDGNRDGLYYATAIRSLKGGA